MATKTKKYRPRAVFARDKHVQVRLTSEEHNALMLHVRETETTAGKLIRSLLKEKGLI